MRTSIYLAAFCTLIPRICIAQQNATILTSHQILPDNFKPPQVFNNVNLLRNINLEKGYVKETVNVVIENVDAEEQDTYYIPFEAHTVANVGGFEVRDKKNPEIPVFPSELVEYDPYRWVPSSN